MEYELVDERGRVTRHTSERAAVEAAERRPGNYELRSPLTVEPQVVISRWYPKYGRTRAFIRGRMKDRIEQDIMARFDEGSEFQWS